MREGVDQTAVIGHPPEHVDWREGDPLHGPVFGMGVRVEAFATIDAGMHQPTQVLFGAWVLKHAHVGHDAVIGPHAIIGTGAIIGGHAHISQHARIGIGAVVLPHRNVGPGAVVGAGAVVTRDVPGGTVVAGNPARVVTKLNGTPHSKRDLEDRLAK